MRRGWSEGGRSYPGRPRRVPERSGRPHRKMGADRRGVSSGHSTGGDRDRREGPNVSPRDDPDRLAIGASTAAIPSERWTFSGSKTVKPSGAGEERSAEPASPEDSPHPARADDLWEVFLSRENLARAMRRVEVNRGAPGPDGMSTVSYTHLTLPTTPYV